VQKYSNVVQDTHGNAIAGVSVQVNLAAGGAATVYSDDGVTPLTNPLTTESDGSFKFYASNGLYSLVMTKSGYTFDSTDTSNIRLYDPANTLPTGTATSGSVMFAGTTGGLTEDNAGFFYDNTNDRLKLGTTGANAGLLIGGDALWYRSAADVMRTPDSVTVDTNLTVTGDVRIDINAVKTNAGAATLSLPTTTDTIVGRATTDTLTNKTLSSPTLTGTATVSGALSAQGNLIGNVADGGMLFGLTLSNNGADATNDIDIAIGQAVSDDAAATSKRKMLLTGSLTKQLDAGWTVGTNQGMRDTGSIANGTWHIYLIMRSDTGVVDILASASASAPTMPTNYDFKRRIGAILRESAAIVAFVQDGDYFRRKASVLDVSTNNPGTSAVTVALSVPVGIKVMAMFNASLLTTAAGATASAHFSDLDANDEAGSLTVAPLHQLSANGQVSAVNQGGLFLIRTNTSAQIRYRLHASAASNTIYIATLGWVDTRGGNN